MPAHATRTATTSIALGARADLDLDGIQKPEVLALARTAAEREALGSCSE